MFNEIDYHFGPSYLVWDSLENLTKSVCHFTILPSSVLHSRPLPAAEAAPADQRRSPRRRRSSRRSSGNVDRALRSRPIATRVGSDGGGCLLGAAGERMAFLAPAQKPAEYVVVRLAGLASARPDEVTVTRAREGEVGGWTPRLTD